MHCYVYKGDKKDDYYLYLPSEFDAEKDDCSVPDAILSLLGELSFVVEFDLTKDRKLPQADAEHALENIQSQGFYLQMPKKDMRALENEYFN